MRTIQEAQDRFFARAEAIAQEEHGQTAGGTWIPNEQLGLLLVGTDLTLGEVESYVSNSVEAIRHAVNEGVFPPTVIAGLLTQALLVGVDIGRSG